MKKIFLIDLAFLGSSWGGHNETYFMKILSILTKHDYFVYTICGDSQRLKENVERDNINNCQIIDIKITFLDKVFRRLLLSIDEFLPPLPKIRYIQFSSLINLITIKKIINNIDDEIPVFFAYTDSIIPALPKIITHFFMPKKWLGLCIVPSYQFSLNSNRMAGRVRFYAEKNFSLPSCKGILALNPLYQKFFSKRFKNLNCFYLPELIDIEPRNLFIFNNHPLIQSIKEKAGDRKIISIIGNLTPRKNLLLFLESMYNLEHEKYFILVLGKLRVINSYPSEEELNKINVFIKLLSNNSWIDIDYHIKNEDEFAQLIDLSDVLFLHYKKHPFSSNILVKAIAHRKPVIVSKGYLMEKMVKKYNWKIATESSPIEIAKACEYLTMNNFEVDESSYLSFMNDYSYKRFESVIVEACSQLYT